MGANWFIKALMIFEMLNLCGTSFGQQAMHKLLVSPPLFNPISQQRFPRIKHNDDVVVDIFYRPSLDIVVYYILIREGIRFMQNVTPPPHFCQMSTF